MEARKKYLDKERSDMANRTIKYMGSSDNRVIEKGEDFGGQLATPLSKTLIWNWENKHIIKTEDFEGVPDEVWDLVLEDTDDFKDVTDLSRIPTNAAQQIWRAMPKTEEAAKAVDAPAEEPKPTTDKAATSVAGATGTGATGAKGRTTT